MDQEIQTIHELPREDSELQIRLSTYDLNNLDALKSIEIKEEVEKKKKEGDFSPWNGQNKDITLKPNDNLVSKY